MSPYLLAAGSMFTGAAALVGAFVAWRRFGVDKGASTVTQWQSLTKSLTEELAEKVGRIERQDDLIDSLYEKIDAERAERVAAEAKNDECQAEKRALVRQLQSQRATLDDFLQGRNPQ